MNPCYGIQLWKEVWHLTGGYWYWALVWETGPCEIDFPDAEAEA